MTYKMKLHMYNAIKHANPVLSDKQMIEYINLTFGLKEIIEIVTY